MNTKLNGKCFEKECELTNEEVCLLYTFFEQSLHAPGYTKTFSLLLLDNLESLHYAKQIIEDNAPKIENIPRFKEYQDKSIALLERCADRDEQGNVLRNENGEYKITEQLVEYLEAKKNLESEYDDIIERINHDEQLQFFYMQEKTKVILVMLDNFDDYPDALPPGFIRIIERFY